MFFRSKKSLFDFAPEGYLTSSGWAPELDIKKSGGGSLIPETRWRTREEAVAATAGPKRREGIAAGARQLRKAEAAKRG
jgi:hypothetical protein